MIYFYLISGVFLGWSLGANHAANVFGTAVASKMVRFKTAAGICSLFVILGAVFGGAGTAATLESLGAVNAMAGAFMVTLAAALSVYWMTKLKLPVSTSQAIIGSILGWNLFSGSVTDFHSLSRIVFSWGAAIVLTALISAVLYVLIRGALKRSRIHILTLDSYTRTGLIIVGAFGAYSLGANNIANVMGVFVAVTPFHDIDVAGLFTLTSVQQLFFLGGIAIAIGVFTYSHKVIQTVGNDLLKISPLAAFIVVLAESIVLFLFSSKGLESWLLAHGLPTFPLVPISSSQAVIGGIIGIAIVRKGREIRYKVLGDIALGWLVTPLIAGVITFFGLFVLQNVFNQEVYRTAEQQASQRRHPVGYLIDQRVLDHLGKEMDTSEIARFRYQVFPKSMVLHGLLKSNTHLTRKQRFAVVHAAEIMAIIIDPRIRSGQVDSRKFTKGQTEALRWIDMEKYTYGWQLFDALERISDEWKPRPVSVANRQFNQDLAARKQLLVQIFRTSKPQDASEGK
jgi:PiT family inorganic phosphate transporter